MPARCISASWTAKAKKLVHTNGLNNDFSYFLKLVAPYKHDLTVCCECMFGWYWLSGPSRRGAPTLFSNAADICSLLNPEGMFDNSPAVSTPGTHARSAHESRTDG